MAAFQVFDKFDYSRFNSKTFLLPDISIKIIFDITF